MSLSQAHKKIIFLYHLHICHRHSHGPRYGRYHHAW